VLNVQKESVFVRPSPTWGEFLVPPIPTPRSNRGISLVDPGLMDSRESDVPPFCAHGGSVSSGFFLRGGFPSPTYASREQPFQKRAPKTTAGASTNREHSIRAGNFVFRQRASSIQLRLCEDLSPLVHDPAALREASSVPNRRARRVCGLSRSATCAGGHRVRSAPGAIVMKLAVTPKPAKRFRLASPCACSPGKKPCTIEARLWRSGLRVLALTSRGGRVADSAPHSSRRVPPALPEGER